MSKPTKQEQVKTCRCGVFQWDEQTASWESCLGRTWVRAWWTRGRCLKCGTWMLPNGVTEYAKGGEVS